MTPNPAETQTPQPSRSFSSRTIIFVIVLVIVGLLVGIWFWNNRPNLQQSEVVAPQGRAQGPPGGGGPVPAPLP